jgi:hypothetical protein
MKTNTFLHVFGALWVLALVTSLALPARAGSKDSENQKDYTGTITGLDTKNHTVKVHGYFFSKDLILADDCKLTMGNQSDASLTDFRTGQRVNVHYRDVGGVLVAERIAEDQMKFSGRVKMIDLAKHTMTVHERGMDKTFQLADKCRVSRHGNAGTLADIKWGDDVTVVYEVPNDQLLARKVDLPDTVYTGPLAAIDLSDRTISTGKRSEKFHLADDCMIIANGKANGRINDLRLGQDYELNYRSVGGVNVVDRIAPAEPATKHEGVAPTAQYIPPEQ